MRKEHRAILVFIRENGGACDINTLTGKFGKNYYRNGKKYIGQIVSTMVKNGQLIRVKPGFFKLNIPIGIDLFTQ